MKRYFSHSRLWGIVVKEFIQMRRDRMTLAMMIGIPLLQLILFGYAINTNPQHLPTAVLAADYSPLTRDFIQGLKNTNYFSIKKIVKTEEEAQDLIQTGQVQFVVNIPENFTRNLVRGKDPAILVEADATDPVATSSALAAINILIKTVFDKTLQGSLAFLKDANQPAQVVIHANYNPENITYYNIVPGLLGVVLTMTMVIITSLAITRERERGTMENLLATTVRPFEVMLGKIIPYVLVGYIQIGLILLLAIFLFEIPVEGNIFLLLLAALPFIAANLAVGLTFSSIARNQLQSMQMAFFFFLPSILLSGFMFPFQGMPEWAQALGQCLPLTHFLRIARGILLKGNNALQIWDDVWPIILFAIIMLILGILRYRRTLE